jgi:hypothetical protein
MDPTLLQQFRQQLATWIESRLESQRLPFQRLEICPKTLTDRGRLTPDLILWINRDSQLAGSMILLPDVVNDTSLAEGVSLAKALGLGHFTTWAAREVSIWDIASGHPMVIHSFALPSANKVNPDDFHQTLNDLLEQLKVVTVTSAPSKAEFSEYYFANLCLRNLRELAPGLTISARVTAGQTAADEWVEHAPQEKAWMSLWRMLFLLWNGRLPPGLQPERLELAIRYALADLTEGKLSLLDLQDSEPPLPEEDAVRMHHLASRLRQLGWPHNDEHAVSLLEILLNEAAHRFDLEVPVLPWSTDTAQLWVACHPPPSAEAFSLVAPRAYIAGLVCKTSLHPSSEDNAYAASIQELDSTQRLDNAIAIMKDVQQPDRKERAARLILLRQVWPNRRFDLPHNTPTWLWDTLYLAGLISESLSLTLPKDWHRAPGIQSLWVVLAERYQLTEITLDEKGSQSLHFVPAGERAVLVRVHRNSQTIEIPYNPATAPQPGTTQIWLKACEDVVKLLNSQTMIKVDTDWSDQPELRSWGVFLFLQTRLGRYLWALCSDQAALPEPNEVSEAILTYGLPIPNENIISDLSLIGDAETETVPDPEYLEREFVSIFGPIPELPASSGNVIPEAPRTRRRSSASSVQVVDKIFQDGIPRFPEHYLMHLYRPELASYELCGQLEVAEAFFDRISLRTIGKEDKIEISGKFTAEALILASYTRATRVSLPKDELILEEMVQHYRADLGQLWDNLTRECRRLEPHRQTAIKLARKIWRQQGLPPENAHRSD